MLLLKNFSTKQQFMFFISSLYKLITPILFLHHQFLYKFSIIKKIYKNKIHSFIYDAISYLSLSSLRIFIKHIVTHLEAFCLNLSLLCIWNHFLTRRVFKMLSGMTRTNSLALPFGSIPSSMTEICSLTAVWAMFTTPVPGMQGVYATIKQLVHSTHKPQLSFL